MGVSSEELVGRAREIAVRAAGRAAEVDRQGSPSDETIQELIDAELIQTLVPARFGGHEQDLETHGAIVETLASACVSTGWVSAFYLGHNWFVTKFSERAQTEVFADRPFGLIPVATAPTMQVTREGEGARLKGTVPWGTGIVHADWVIVSGASEGELPQMFLLPAEDARPAGNWNMSGMSGTGSHDILIDDAFVPDHRILPITGLIDGQTEGTALHANPLYRMPMMPFLYCEAMPVFSGGLRGAADAFETTVRNRVTTYGQARAAEAQLAHVELGAARARADVAGSIVREIVSRTKRWHGEGNWSFERRIELKGLAGFLVDHCRSATNEMVQHAGASSFHREAPLQRFFRDLNVLATHAFWDWDVAREQVGRAAVDLPPTYPLI